MLSYAAWALTSIICADLANKLLHLKLTKRYGQVVGVVASRARGPGLNPVVFGKKKYQDSAFLFGAIELRLRTKI